jgi:hypothetical protein
VTGLAADVTFNVVAGDGTLTVAADDVRVNQGFAYTWTGNQTWAGTATFNGALLSTALDTFSGGANFTAGVYTFSTAPQINANLAFIGGDRTITASANLSVAPAANLTLSPTGGIVYLPDAVEERSATFADLVTGINGFRLWTTGGTARQLTIGSIKVDSLITKAFTTDAIRLEQGDSYWGKGYGVVETAFVLPALNADVNVYFDNVPNLAGQIFTVNDKLLCRIVQWTTGVSVKLIWFNVKAYIGADDPNFRQQWTLTRLSGGATADAIGKGVVMEDSGTIGQGWIHVTSMTGGPYMEFGTQTSVAAGVPQFTQNVRIGQLSGTVDYASTAWGLVSGNNLGIDQAHGFSGITLDNTVQGMRVFNAAYQLYNGANLILSLEKTNGLSIEFGTSAFNSIGWYEDLGTGTPSGLLGTVGMTRPSAPYNELDIIGQGIATTYTVGAVKLRGQNFAGAAYNVFVDANGVFFGTGSGVESQTAGFIKDATSYFAGRVGIGTSTPTTPEVYSRLAVSGSDTTAVYASVINTAAGQAGLVLNRTGTTPARWVAYVPAAADELQLYSGTLVASVMTLKSTGLVGIGVTNPGVALDVARDGAGVIRATVTDDTNASSAQFIASTNGGDVLGYLVAYDTLLTGTRFGLPIGGSVAYISNGAGVTGMTIGNITAAPITFGTNNLERVRIDAAGNVGIGQPSPGTLLHVGLATQAINNAAGIWVAPNSTTAGIHIRNTGGIETGILSWTTSSYMGTWSNHALAIRTNNLDRISITAAGAVTVANLLTASAGISFGQNTLTQYDESPAVWTPTITPSSGAFGTLTYTAQTGKATRVGNCVFFQGSITINAFSIGTASGNARFSLPVTCAAFILSSGLYNAGTTLVSTAFTPQAGLTYGLFSTTSTSPQSVQCSALAAGQSWYYGGIYFV